MEAKSKIKSKTGQFQTSQVIILLCSILVIMFMFPFSIFSSERKQETFKTSKEPGIMQVRPNKPVKIKLRRSAKGEYSWELSGDSVDEIVKADRRLRRLLNIE